MPTTSAKPHSLTSITKSVGLTRRPRQIFTDEGGIASSDATIGTVTLSPANFENGQVDDNWYKMHFQGKEAGEIRLRIQLMRGGERPIAPGGAQGGIGSSIPAGAPAAAAAPPMAPVPAPMAAAPPQELGDFAILLEGGYSLSALRACSVAHLHGLRDAA